MIKEEEAKLMRRIMKDSMNTYDERQREGLETQLALSTAGDMAIPELEMADVVKKEVQEEVEEEPPIAAWNPHLVAQQWSWSSTTSDITDSLGVNPWSPHATTVIDA
ncbi:hypothetical protein D1007_14722 [Hordeum vulgare]|nr:hypothetical protein D1007_14722 [Hordeum vulgare]